MRLFHAILTVLFVLSFLGGPVTGALAADQPESACAMHAQKDAVDAPANAPLHQCKTCIGCAPSPAPALSPSPSMEPGTLAVVVWIAPADLHTGRTTAPDPAPPRPRL